MPRSLLARAARALGVAAVAAALIVTGALHLVQRPVADLLLRTAAQRPPDHPGSVADVAIVALDPQSLRAHPDWPWSRSLYAEVVRRLTDAGARVIAFDIDFSTDRDSAGDAAFERAIVESGRVVLSAFRQYQAMPGGTRLEIASLPAPRFREAAREVASVQIPIDFDGVVRRAPRVTTIAGERLPALAEAALAIALEHDVGEPVSSTFRIDYRRSSPEFPVIPVADVIDGRFDASDVAGRIVLVGATAAEFQDFWSTPVGPARPGVWIQAIAVRTLAAAYAGRGVMRATPLGVDIAVALAVSILAALIGTASDRRRLLGMIGFAAGTVAASAWLVSDQGILIDPVIPVAVIGVHYVLGLETLRSRFGRRLAEREISLTTLFRVGEATAQPAAGDPLETALGLLGDVVNASGVSVFRASPDGRLDGSQLVWCRDEESTVGDAETASSILADRRVRIFEGHRPGSRTRGGLAVYVPLMAGMAPVGVLVVERQRNAPLDETQLRTIATIGTQLALSAENVRLLSSLRATFEASVESIATAIEARDGYTELHCRRLAAFSVVMAERVGLTADEVEAIRLGALLHDVGKIGICDEVLLKPGRFTPEERTRMEKHPEIGCRIIQGIPGIARTTLDCILHHHEWWDGSGYPMRLFGNRIPLGARIVSIVDVWDALSTPRPYKAAYPQETVRLILGKASGTQFDPDLLELFTGILDEEGSELLARIGDKKRGAECGG